MALVTLKSFKRSRNTNEQSSNTRRSTSFQPSSTHKRTIHRTTTQRSTAYKPSRVISSANTYQSISNMSTSNSAHLPNRPLTTCQPTRTQPSIEGGQSSSSRAGTSVQPVPLISPLLQSAPAGPQDLDEYVANLNLRIDELKLSAERLSTGTVSRTQALDVFRDITDSCRVLMQVTEDAAREREESLRPAQEGRSVDAGDQVAPQSPRDQTVEEDQEQRVISAPRRIEVVRREDFIIDLDDDDGGEIQLAFSYDGDLVWTQYSPTLSEEDLG